MATKRRTAKKTSTRKPKRPTQVCVEIVRGVGGLSVYLNGYRIVGEKPWGGGTVVRRWLIDEKDVEVAMENHRVDPKEVQLI